MRLRIGHPRTTLVIAPHSDDETIGAFALIGDLRRRGMQVRVVIVTNGAASHSGSARWSRSRLVAERRRETRRAMRRLGVAAGDIAFLGLPDGAMDPASVQQGRVIARAIRRTRRLDLLVGPSPRDDHADHRAVAVTVAHAGRGVRRLAYLVWPGRRAPRPGPHRGVAVVSTLAKRAAILRYRTQTGAIADDPQGFTIARTDLARFARPLELYEASSW